MTEIAFEQGNYRTRVEHDENGYDFKPDGDYFGTVYRLETGWHTRVDMLGSSYDEHGAGLEDVITEVWRERRDMDEVEAVLRGLANFCTHCDTFIDYYGHDSEGNHVCDPDQEGAFHEPRFDLHEYGVVGFDYIDRDYGKLINVVTLDDLKMWGYDSAYEFGLAHPGEDPSKDNLKDWEAWADGDVFYIVLEEKVITREEVRRLDGTLIRIDEAEEWDEVDATYGYLGLDWAEQCAKEWVERHAEDHEEVVA